MLDRSANNKEKKIEESIYVEQFSIKACIKSLKNALT